VQVVNKGATLKMGATSSNWCNAVHLMIIMKSNKKI